jgi:hypothetical protein
VKNCGAWPVVMIGCIRIMILSFKGVDLYCVNLFMFLFGHLKDIGTKKHNDYI